MQSWDDWIKVNKEKIKHPAGYEEQFVKSVLSQIPEIRPQDVYAQYHFTDFKGGNRYIDFMIKNESKGYILPIELDGYWKVQNYHDFNDMLDRQNALVTKYRIPHTASLYQWPNEQQCSNDYSRYTSDIKISV
ncbi:hypothetical protein EC844_101270 [Acinetobacter calcoaceticus]|uniref:DUF559 domain-containing protein n=1 Tax=Acinetobacter calcoaceticus TaxID=471 RepID=A0A4R1Y1L7_ACICA|nr:hypothetical protein EC844_101270 [Acinetobacter calcoaceticus]